MEVLENAGVVKIVKMAEIQVTKGKRPQAGSVRIVRIPYDVIITHRRALLMMRSVRCRSVDAVIHFLEPSLDVLLQLRHLDLWQLKAGTCSVCGSVRMVTSVFEPDVDACVAKGAMRGACVANC
ncbi:hypothetical protein SFRURICE_012583 [Spodoptera frugiperda]|uniref:SFRICE_001100 n=1 Tax=Spodoptera frugiperda TaxID=7108 RepID=A0A2H1W285_SPOFR|nr:hypothetical protein SFRURICE_012583 [Spodoptera frugiperda]